jgi:hypothetical protein
MLKHTIVKLFSGVNFGRLLGTVGRNVGTVGTVGTVSILNAYAEEESGKEGTRFSSGGV